MEGGEMSSLPLWNFQMQAVICVEDKVFFPPPPRIPYPFMWESYGYFLNSHNTML